MIEFELGFQYAEEQRAALQQVSGEVAKGRCVVLCGSSGCGKSTLLRCVNGLIPQFYEGERKGFCRLAGQENADLSIGEIGELAASVFQDPRSQFFTVNSSGEVAFGLENHGVPQEKIRQRVDEAFRVFHLEHLQDRNVYELSSGERQLISILAAWAMDTEIFLLDEPTANLDFAATRQLREILLALKQQGKTLLLSEHRLYYLTGVADEFWVMEHGRIRGKYTAEETAGFTQEQLRSLSLRTLDLREIIVPEAVRTAETEAQSQGAEEPVMLAAEDLRFAYGARGGAKREGKQTPPLLAGVSFAARRHEVVGLIGANGCGKTTAGKLLAGLYKPSGGAVLLEGRPQPPKKLQEQVMFIMQEAEFQFFTDSVLHELQYGHTVTPAFSERVETLLKSADMWECRQRHPFSLSGGQMQKLTLMTACLSEKPIVVLDEPTAGQDAESLETCAALIREMQKEKTVLIITHDLELIAKTCGRCIGLSGGRVEAEFSVRKTADLAAIRDYMERFCTAGTPPDREQVQGREAGAGAVQLREQAPPVLPRYGKARFHPLTKLAFWLVVMIAISTANNRFAFTVYGALLLAAADGWIGTALAGAGLFGVLWTAAAVFPHTVCTFLLVLFPRIIAIWISMQTLIGRNEAGRTLTALRQCHLPERLIMVVAVIFRFFPVLAGDMKLLRQSIATRGAFVTFGQKLRAFPSYLEILTIPMALRVIRIAETLSASAETRGIDLRGRKTNYLILHGSLWDAVFGVILLTAVIAGLWR